MNNLTYKSGDGILEKLDEVKDSINSTIDNENNSLGKKLDEVKESISGNNGLRIKIENQSKILKKIEENQPVHKKANTIIGKFLQKITKIEVIAVIIALLQFIIALPQLKVALNSIFHDETKELNAAFTDFVNHTENMALIQIPDSLLTSEIIGIRELQLKLFFNLKLLSQAESSLTYFLSGTKEKNPMVLTNSLLIIQDLNDCCIEINKIEQQIMSRFYPNENSKYISSDNIYKKIMTIYVPIHNMIEMQNLQNKFSYKLTSLYNKMNANNSQRRKEIFDINSTIRKEMPVYEFVDYISFQDKVGLNFIKALNQMQFYLAYVK